MGRQLKNSRINPASNPDYVEDVDGLDSDASGAAVRRTETIAASVVATTNAGDFDARAAAKAALKNALKG